MNRYLGPRQRLRLAKLIRAARLKRNITQRELTKECKVALTAIRAIEHNRPYIPREVYYDVAQILNIPIKQSYKKHIPLKIIVGNKEVFLNAPQVVYDHNQKITADNKEKEGFCLAITVLMCLIIGMLLIVLGELLTGVL